MRKSAGQWLRELLNARPGHDLSVLWNWASAKPRPAADQEWLAVCFKLSDSQFGTAGERDVAHRFSDQLVAAIAMRGVGTFDGDEFGNGEGTLFMYGPNADRLFEAVEPLLRTWEPLKGGHLINRCGSRAGSERIEF